MDRRRQPQQPNRTVYGEAGSGLVDAKWAANDAVARVGRAGELKTAAVLNEAVNCAQTRSGGPVVLHDVAIPIPGFSANIDHIVVSGRTVLMLDSKAWAAGFYWTFGSTSRRGWSPFKPADSKTMPMALDAIGRYLGARSVKADIVTPLVVVWPTGTAKPTRLFALRMQRSRVLTGDRFSRSARRLVGREPADPAIVEALARLVNGRAPATGRPFSAAAPTDTTSTGRAWPTQPVRTPTFSAAPAQDWLDESDPFAAPFVRPPARTDDWDDF